jgi:hypothetical protein
MPSLRAAEVVLLPAPRLRPLPGLVPGSDFMISAPFDLLQLKLGQDIPHHTVQ